MATVTGLTAERMQEIIDSTIVDADIISGNLILTKYDGSTINAGGVSGGASSSIPTVTAFPPAPEDGEAVIRVDMDGSPLYLYSIEHGWTSIYVNDTWHTVGNTGEPAYNGLFVASFRPIQFSKDGNGIVRIRGLIQSPNPEPAIGAVIFTLPVGYRPGMLSAFLLSTSANDAVTRVARVNTNGEVTAGSSNAWPLGEFINFYQVTFRAEN